MKSAQDALQALKTGNQRFVDGKSIHEAEYFPEHRQGLTQGQQPFAVVLTCADSRVPVELVFDAGLGELFVIRVAGNIAAPTQVGSVEFAIAKLDVKLVVVLGHTSCGAVQATLDHIANPDAGLSDHLHSIVGRIRPAVEPTLSGSHTDPVNAAVQANVKQTVSQLEYALAGYQGTNPFEIKGACYDLTSGVVDFYDA